MDWEQEQYWVDGVRDAIEPLDNPLLKWDEEHSILTNTYPCVIGIPRGRGYVAEAFKATSVFHAYHACMASRLEDAVSILKSDSTSFILAKAKSMEVRKDWSLHQYPLMRELILNKFNRRWPWKRILKATEPRLLLNRSMSGDTYWGVIWDGKNTWVGTNQLGNILMDVRSYLLEIDIY